MFIERDAAKDHNRQNEFRPLSSHLDRASVVNKEFIIWKKEQTLLSGYSGQSLAGKIAPSCPLGQPITAQDIVHLGHANSLPYNNIYRDLAKPKAEILITIINHN